MDERILNRFREACGDGAVLTDEPMSKHTTFRIGGPADLFLVPNDTERIGDLIRICQEENLPWFVLGNGSNLLVSDQGYRGVVICMDKNLSAIEVDGLKIRAQAGAMLSKIAAAARDNSLTGLEFAAGIPGSLGGAVTMNAGAYGGEMKQVLTSVRILDENLEIREMAAEDLNLGYRTSRVQSENWIVLEAAMELKEGDQEAIIAKMAELRVSRTTKQPLEYPSAGSTFKRPEGYFAGKLIMDSGLKGFRVGGAEVSEKHAGFVINKDNASAEDVSNLIRRVQDIVWEKFHVQLEPEVRFLGFK